MGAHHSERICPGRSLRAPLDHDSAVDRAAAFQRRNADAHPAAGRGGGDARDLRAVRFCAQLREHHRVTRAARRGRRVQDLLRDGVAKRGNQLPAIEPHARGVLQRPHDCDGLRQSLAVPASRHVEHGQAAGALPAVHARGSSRQARQNECCNIQCATLALGAGRSRRNATGTSTAAIKARPANTSM
jgi:hypothetical protein